MWFQELCCQGHLALVGSPKANRFLVRAQIYIYPYETNIMGQELRPEPMGSGRVLATLWAYRPKEAPQGRSLVAETADWRGSSNDEDAVPICCNEQKSECKSEAVITFPTLTHGHELGKNEIADGRNELPPKGGCTLPEMGEEFGHSGASWGGLCF